MPLPSLHLRQVSTGNFTSGQDVQDKYRTETFSNLSKSASTSQVPLKRICSLSIHDDSRNDVLVNLDRLQSDDIKVGDLMQIKAFNGPANTSMDTSGSQLYSQGRGSTLCPDNEFYSPTANSRASGQKQKRDRSEPASDLSQRLVFAVKDMSLEQKAKQLGCQVCCTALIIPYSFF